MGEGSSLPPVKPEPGPRADPALREATAYFEQAVKALAHLPESADTLREAIDLRVELRQALFPLGEMDRGFEYLHQAETLAVVLGDQRRLGQIRGVDDALSFGCSASLTRPSLLGDARSRSPTRLVISRYRST